MTRGARLGAAALAGVLLAGWLPGLFYQARDVDVLLYAAAAARANAEGALPYTAAWIEKGPLAMALFQGLFAATGPYNLAAVALAWVALALCTTALVWLLALALGAGRGAPWAAALYAAALPSVGGTLNTEVPAAAAGAAAVAVACAALGSRRGDLRLSALAGLLAGAAFLCRQNAGILWPVLLAGEAAAVAWRGRPTKRAVAAAAVLSAGFLLPVALVVALYAWAGHLAVFLFCFHGYNVNYYIAATRVTWLRLLASPLAAARHFLLPVPATSALGLAGLGLAAAAVWRSRRSGGSAAVDPVHDRRPEMVLVGLAAVALTLSLFTGLRFFSHYFALPLPFFAAAAGLALGRLGRLSAGRAATAALAVVLVAAMALELRTRPWWRTGARLKAWVVSGAILEAADPLAWPGRDGLAAAAARHIREGSTRHDRIFVWGKRPHVYAYARRVPATRFVTCTFLTGLVPWERAAPDDDTTGWIVPGAWDLLMEDLERERPLFVVDAADDHLFGDGAYAIERFPRLHAFLQAGYAVDFEAGEEDRLVVWRRRAP